eukprot:7378843-Prymnesium_polylepis.1
MRGSEGNSAGKDVAKTGNSHVEVGAPRRPNGHGHASPALQPPCAASDMSARAHTGMRTARKNESTSLNRASSNANHALACKTPVRNPLVIRCTSTACDRLGVYFECRLVSICAVSISPSGARTLVMTTPAKNSWLHCFQRDSTHCARLLRWSRSPLMSTKPGIAMICTLSTMNARRGESMMM